MYRQFIGIVLYVTILNSSFFKKTVAQIKARDIYKGGEKKRFDFFLKQEKARRVSSVSLLLLFFFLAISCLGGLLRQCFQR